MITGNSSDLHWAAAFSIIMKLSLIVDKDVICRELLKGVAEQFDVRQQFYYEKTEAGLEQAASWPLATTATAQHVLLEVTSLFSQSARGEQVPTISAAYIALPVTIYGELIGVWLIPTEQEQLDLRIDILQYLAKFLGNQLYMAQLIQTFQNRVFEDLALANQQAVQREAMIAQQARSEALYDYLANTSHDFLTPLASILSAADLLRRTTDPARQLLKINQIEQNVDDVVRKVRQVMLITKLRQPSIDDFVLSISPVAVVHTYLKSNVLPKLEKQTKIVHLEDPAEAALNINVQVDLEYLGVALSNVIENALRYADDTVSITFVSEHSNLVIRIADNGPGLAPHISARLFEPLFRGQTHRPEGASHGLGLPIAKLIIEYMHGSIAIREHLPSGTLVEIYLPASR